MSWVLGMVPNTYPKTQLFLGSYVCTIVYSKTGLFVLFDESSIKKKPACANPSGKRRGRKPYPIDADGNKIRPEKENKDPGQKQKKSK